jgi:hypothetical protein
VKHILIILNYLLRKLIYININKYVIQYEKEVDSEPYTLTILTSDTKEDIDFLFGDYVNG